MRKRKAKKKWTRRNERGMKMGSWNVQRLDDIGIKMKELLLTVVLGKAKMDVVCLTETGRKKLKLKDMSREAIIGERERIDQEEYDS